MSIEDANSSAKSAKALNSHAESSTPRVATETPPSGQLRSLPRNDELTTNVTGWLYNLLSGGNVMLPANQVENLALAKDWLARVNLGKIQVITHDE